MYTQAILLKAKRAKRKSARIEDDVAEMYVHGLLNNWKVRNKHRKKGGGNGEKNKVTLELYVINSEFLAFVDSEDMKEAPSRLLLLREVHIPMSAVNIECAVTLYQASAWSWLEKLIKRFVHLVQEFKRKREMMGIGRQLHVSTLLCSILSQNWIPITYLKVAYCRTFFFSQEKLSLTCCLHLQCWATIIITLGELANWFMRPRPGVFLLV